MEYTNADITRERRNKSDTIVREPGLDVGSHVGDAAIGLVQALIDIRRPILIRGPIGDATVVRLKQMVPVIGLHERLTGDEKLCRNSRLAAKEIPERGNFII